jgi:hypothetical protein
LWKGIIHDPPPAVKGDAAMTYFPTKDNLEQFNLLFCPVLEKWVCEDTCIWCNCKRYPPNDFRCNVWHDRGKFYKSNKERPCKASCWTTKQIVAQMQKEEERVKQINKENGYKKRGAL